VQADERMNRSAATDRDRASAGTVDALDVIFRTELIFVIAGCKLQFCGPWRIPIQIPTEGMGETRRHCILDLSRIRATAEQFRNGCYTLGKLLEVPPGVAIWKSKKPHHLAKPGIDENRPLVD
jgi:hypothetical protein